MITPNNIHDYIEKTEYISLGKKTTVCLLTTTFGMEVVGYSHTQSIEDNNIELGQKSARNNAISELYPIVIAYTSSK